MKTIIKLSLALLFTVFSTFTAEAQSLRKIRKAANTISDHVGGFDIEGTWDYTGSSVKFESDNLMKKAGGVAAANVAENQLDEILERLGVRPGYTTFNFDDDGTFAHAVGDKPMKGTYTYNKESGTVTLKYANLVPVTATVAGKGGTMSLMMRTDSLLTILSAASTATELYTSKLLNVILDSYSGMLIGLEFKKTRD